MSESWNIAQAAEFLKIHPDTLAARAREGIIPGARIGRAWVFLPELLREWLDARASSKKPKQQQKPKPTFRDLRRASEKIAAAGNGYAWTDRRGRHSKVIRQATPPWADEGAIRAVYERARATTRQTGRRHHVDHAIPLRNDLVSGLHVESNLQILTCEENSRKSNGHQSDWGNDDDC